ncbi:MAG: hypothetical protein GXO73_04455 [Calditrichaeota bacterium]|nr:hypothetical protein [Calditrichota bacterium]
MRSKVLSLALVLGLVAVVSCGKKQAAEQAPAAAKMFTVAVLNDSTVSVEGQTVPLDSLAAVLKAKGCDSTAAVTLQPAADVSMGTIDSVHTILRQLGVEKISNKSPAQ